jgi:tetratricopeptide (TPR) repeat protein
MKQHLRIFISSTIRECAAERAAAKAAVTSLRHQPILFEDLGASPHAPRPLYVRELSTSDVFVGIYRDSYGWGAPNATISGLEDEHQLRTKLGLPPLIYVLRPEGARDAQLTRIIDEAGQGSTLAFYSDPAELEERIAKDLTALIAEGFDALRLTQGDASGPAGVPSSSAGPTATPPNTLDPLAFDLLSALAAARSALTVEELAAASNEKVAAVIRALGGLSTALAVRGNSVALTEPVPSIIAKYRVLENQAQVDFYTHRVATVFEQDGRTLDAYLLFETIKNPRAERLLARAAREATVTGRIDLALLLLRLNVDRAKSEGEPDVAVSFLVSTAVLSMSAGNVHAARAALEEAKTLDAHDLDLWVREVELHVRTESTGDDAAMQELASLRKSFDAEGDKYGVARIATTQSKLYIELRRFPEAAESARLAVELFAAQGNDDGRHAALHNLIASLSAQGGHDDEVRRLTESVPEERSSTARMRAFQCNLAASRLRQAGEPAAAAEKSREAIAIGEQLGDVSLQLTNRINLGNALSDLGQVDEAIAEYKTVSAKASSAGLRIVEGAATRLIATTLNDAKRWAEAVTFAQHAAGLLRDTVDSKNFINSKREEATAQLALGELKLGLAAYQEAAIAARRTGLHSKLAGILIDLAKIEDGEPEDVLGVALAVCGADPAPTPADAVFRLAGQMGPLLAGLPVSARGQIARALFSRALANCPPAALGSVTESIAAELLAKLSSSESGDLQVFANFILAFNPRLLSLRQWNVIADKAATKFPQLIYKPFNDGAGHWTVVVDQRLIATIAEMDDTPESFAAALCLAAGLCGVGASYLDALGATTLPRREAVVHVTTRSELIELIGEKFAPEAGEVLTVSRATNEAEEAPPGIQVILDDDLQLGPHEELNGITAATYLLTRSLYEMARHLLKGQVTESALIRRLRPVIFPFYS